MRLATESLGVLSIWLSTPAVAPPARDEPITSPLYREAPTRPSALAAVAPLHSDEPIASPFHRETPTRLSALVAVAPSPSDEPIASPLQHEKSARPSTSEVAPIPSDEATASLLQCERHISGNGAALQSANIYSRFDKEMLDFEEEMLDFEARMDARRRESQAEHEAWMARIDDELNGQARISPTNTPEDFNTGGNQKQTL